MNRFFLAIEVLGRLARNAPSYDEYEYYAIRAMLPILRDFSKRGFEFPDPGPPISWDSVLGRHVAITRAGVDEDLGIAAVSYTCDPARVFDEVWRREGVDYMICGDIFPNYIDGLCARFFNIPDVSFVEIFRDGSGMCVVGTHTPQTVPTVKDVAQAKIEKTYLEQRRMLGERWTLPAAVSLMAAIPAADKAVDAADKAVAAADKAVAAADRAKDAANRAEAAAGKAVAAAGRVAVDARKAVVDARKAAAAAGRAASFAGGAATSAIGAASSAIGAAVTAREAAVAASRAAVAAGKTVVDDCKAVVDDRKATAAADRAMAAADRAADAAGSAAVAAGRAAEAAGRAAANHPQRFPKLC